MTTTMNRQPQGTPVGGQFATTVHSEPECGIQAPAPISGPEFYAAITSIENDFQEGQDKTQHGYMIRAINEMKEQCPNVASFALTCEEDLEAEDILNADGSEASDADKAAMRGIWHYRDEDDYTEYINEDINVQEILDTWQPNGAAPGVAPTAGPEFEATLDAIADSTDQARQKAQHGYMLMAIDEMKDRVPNVASFTLTCEDDLEPEDIVDVDGNEVSEAEIAVMRHIWHYRREDDYTRYLNDETVDVQEIKDTWKP